MAGQQLSTIYDVLMKILSIYNDFSVNRRHLTSNMVDSIKNLESVSYFVSY